MSYHIKVRGWVGRDQGEATARFAKVFRMQDADAAGIMRDILRGDSWRFEHAVSLEQSEEARTYLQKLGYQVELIPVVATRPLATKTLRETLAPPTEEASPPQSVFDFPKKGKSTPLTAEEKKPAPSLKSSLRPVSSNALTANSRKFSFHGSGGGLFSITIVNLVFNVLTLGIYHFWGKTRVRNYLLSQSELAGNRFAYHGTGKELFSAFFKLAGAFLGAGLAIYLLISVAGGGGLDFLQFLDLISNFFPLLLVLWLPILMVGAWRYRLTRITWKGIRFTFKGDNRTAFFLFAKGWLLCLLTIGFYTPFFFVQRQNFWRSHSFFGNMKFEFSGEGKELFRSFLMALLLTIPTLGLNWIWYKAFVQEYVWNHTRIGEAHFRFSASGKEWMALYSVNFLLLAFTFGLAYPWVTVRSQKFFFDHLTLEGILDLDDVVQSMMRSGALGEDMIDALDAPMDVLG